MNPRYARVRFLVFATVILVAMGAIFTRLAWIQLAGHERARRQVVRMSVNIAELHPRRGAILDRLGYPLAVTEERFDVGVSRPDVWREPENARRLAAVLVTDALADSTRSKGAPQGPCDCWKEKSSSVEGDREDDTGREWSGEEERRIEEMSRRIRQLLRDRHSHTYLERAAILSPRKVECLHALGGLSVDPVFVRNYPMDQVAARLLGRVNRSGKGDAGIEQLCERELAGQAGRVLNRYDGKKGGGPIISRVLQQPRQGMDVVLTLDHRVQMILEEELEATLQEAEAQGVLGVVMDPRDGSVLAVASAPGIPTRSDRPYLTREWRDPVVLDAFEPGSSFKLFTAASLFRRGLCDTTEVFDGEGHPGQYRSSADLGGFVFHDVHPVGRVSLHTAFVVSSNIIFGKAASLLEPEEFHADLRLFGLGMPTGCGLAGENPGILRDPQSWSSRSQATIAIGQEVSVSLLQMAAGYSALLTDGTLRAPRFVAARRDAQGREYPVPPRVIRENIVPPHVPPILRALCRDVVQQDWGSGRAARVEGLEVGGKTGTAQVARTDGRGYEKDAYTANFIGVVPALSPQLLVGIVVRRPSVQRRWGGDTAARCFSRVVSKILSGTRLLEPGTSDAAASMAAGRIAQVEAPRLVGLRADEAQRRIAERGCRLANEAPTASARVVGQVPAAGVQLARGATVHVVWSREALR